MQMGERHRPISGSHGGATQAKAKTLEQPERHRPIAGSPESARRESNKGKRARRHAYGIQKKKPRQRCPSPPEFSASSSCGL